MSRQDDWMLTPEQMLFMMQNHNVIERAFTADDLDFLRQFAASEDFRTLFGDMGFDEAYDRCETWHLTRWVIDRLSS